MSSTSGSEQHFDVQRLQQLTIVVRRARIGSEILVRPELQRIDEHADDDVIRQLGRAA